MKNKVTLILLFVMAMLSWSCNENPKNNNDAPIEVAKTKKAQKKNAQKKLLERLKNTRPVALDDLEDWIPKTLGGLSLERTKSISVFNEAQMTGWYKRVGDKIILLSISDAAGPNGEMIASKVNVFGTEPDSDAGDIQMRSVNVKGWMARQDYSIEKNVTNILFFHNKRFMIKISAFDQSADETWALVDELNFDALDLLVE